MYLIATVAYSRFSKAFKAAMFVLLNKEKAAMLVSRPNPPGIELCYYAVLYKRFLFVWLKNITVDYVIENQQ